MTQDSFDFKGPLFRTDEAAAYLQYRGKHRLKSLYRFLAQRGVPTSRRFRTVLIKKVDLDRAINLTSVRPQRRSA